MNHLLRREALAIQTKLNDAQQKVAERERILEEMATIDGRLAQLCKQQRPLEQKVQQAQQQWDVIRGRVWPVVRGWLKGHGSPQKQAAAAEKRWRMASAEFAKQQKQIELLEHELEALQIELQDVATAEDALQKAFAQREAWLIANGKEGHTLKQLIAQISEVQQQHSAYAVALQAGNQLVGNLEKGQPYLWPSQENSLLLYKLLHIGSLTAALPDPDKLAADDQEVLRARAAVSHGIALFQEKLTPLGERLWPEPTIDWRTLHNFQEAYLVKQSLARSVCTKIERLHGLYEGCKTQLHRLTQAKETLIQQLWEEIQSRPTDHTSK